MPLLRMLSASPSRNVWSKTFRGLVEDSTNSARGTFAYSCNGFTASFALISLSPFSLFRKVFSYFVTLERRAGNKHGAGSLLAARCGSSRLQNGSSGGED